MFWLTIDRLITVIVEIVVGTFELIILLAFGIAVVVWAIELFAPGIVIW